MVASNPIEEAAPMRHHPIAELFPMMSGLDFATFKADILANGLLDPIWTYRGEIIDGRNRERACRETGVEPRFQEWDGKGSLVAFVVSLNLRRRHLDETQRAVIAAKLKPMLSREAAERKADERAGANLRPAQDDAGNGRTSHAAAAMLNVSPRSVDSAAKVLRDGTPALVKAVETGTVSVSAAAAVAELPRREQARAVARGVPGVRAAAASVNHAKRSRPVKPALADDPGARFTACARALRGRIRDLLADGRFRSSADDEWTASARHDWATALREFIAAALAAIETMEGGEAPGN